MVIANLQEPYASNTNKDNTIITTHLLLLRKIVTSDGWTGPTQWIYMPSWSQTVIHLRHLPARGMQLYLRELPIEAFAMLSWIIPGNIRRVSGLPVGSTELSDAAFLFSKFQTPTKILQQQTRRFHYYDLP